MHEKCSEFRTLYAIAASLSDSARGLPVEESPLEGLFVECAPGDNALASIEVEFISALLIKSTHYQ